MRLVKNISGICVLTALWMLFQISNITDHYTFKRSTDVRHFLSHFDLLTIGRTKKQEKGIEYWIDWLSDIAGIQVFNKTLTLLHFDVHGMQDNNNQNFQTCTAMNLWMYDLFVEEVLEGIDFLYNDDAFDYGYESGTQEEIDMNINATRHALNHGYLKDIVWIFPDHWLEFSQHNNKSQKQQSIFFDCDFQVFLDVIYEQTFFVRIGKTNANASKFIHLQKNAEYFDEHAKQIWHKLFADTKLQEWSLSNDNDDSGGGVGSVSVLNSSDYIEVHVWVLSLKQYLNEEYFSANNTNNDIILDIDLDFFMCQSPAHTFMEFFDWNGDLVEEFNGILDNHQYLPSHMFSEHSNEAIHTLLFQLMANHNDNKNHSIRHSLLSMEEQALLEEHRSDSKNRNNRHNNSNEVIPGHKMPSIEDVLQIALEHELSIDTIWRALCLLLEYQLEREDFTEHETAQHLYHFDTVFKVLNITRRKLLDLDIIQEVSTQKQYSYMQGHSSALFKRNQHWSHILKSSKHKAKMQRLTRERREIERIKEYEEDPDKVDMELDDAANTLIAEHERRRRRRKLLLNLNLNMHDVNANVPSDDNAMEAIVTENGEQHSFAAPPMITETETADDIAQQKQYSDYYSNPMGSKYDRFNDHELKDLFGMTTDYLYDGWQPLLLPSKSSNANAAVDADEKNITWKLKYPQFMARLTKQIQQQQQEKQPKEIDRNTVVGDLNALKAQLLQVHKQQTTTKLEEESHSQQDSSGVIQILSVINNTKIKSNQKLQSKFALHFADLDPLQRHFLHTSNHSQLRTFTSNLNLKQKTLLQWMLFCLSLSLSQSHHQNHRQRDICQSKEHFPLSFFNHSRHFGYNTEWHEINEWPSISAEASKSDALQIGFFKSGTHRRTVPYMDADALPHEIKTGLNDEYRNALLSEFQQLLLSHSESHPPSQPSPFLIAGVEQSPAHIPRSHRNQLECNVLRIMQHSLFRRNTKRPQLVRYTKVNMEDEFILHPKCKRVH